MKIDKLSIGVTFKRCDECSRGDCDKCYYKDELARLLSLPNCTDCGLLIRRPERCEFIPKIGEGVRINCPLWVPREAAENKRIKEAEQ